MILGGSMSINCFVIGGQNWYTQLNDVFFNDLDLRRPDHLLNIVGKNLG